MTQDAAGTPSTKPRRFIQHVGIKFDETKPDHARMYLPIESHHLNGIGVAHGGALFSLVDTAMGAAVYSGLAPSEGCVTIEIKIAYFKPVVGGTVICEADVIHRGRRTVAVEGKLLVDGVLMAKATGTFAVIARKPSSTLPKPADPPAQAAVDGR